jgi:tRNA threonylcarbamoyladenosine biosynthesis protein TsaE
MSAVETLRAGIVTASAEKTQELAAALAHELPENCTLALHGTLGVGKTTFVQGLARGFEIPGHVTSPTFNIYAVHEGGWRQLVHLDAYRLDSGAQIDGLLLEEFLKPPYCLAVEWPEKITDWVPANAWHLELGIRDNKHHSLRLLSSP